MEHDRGPSRAPGCCIPTSKPTLTGAPAKPALGEAVSLAAALPGLEVVGAEIVRLPQGRMPGMLFGTGKIEELKARFTADEIELVLVDGPVSPVQQRNLEKAWGVKLLDRTGLILEIFSRPRPHPRRRVAGRNGGADLSAHPAGAGLDPPGTPARRAWLRRRPRRDPDRGRPPRHRRAAGAPAAATGQGGQDPRPAPRGARQGAVSRSSRWWAIPTPANRRCSTG